MTYVDELLGIAIKKIPCIIKSNEIPNARYFIFNGYLMIELYDTVLFFYKMNDMNIISPIEFTISINENKELVPCIINTSGVLAAMFYNYINIPMYNAIIAEQNDLQDDPEFSKLLALKAADGMKFYKMPNNELYSISYLPVFTGFPAIVKNDCISAKVYKDSTEGYSIVEYTIYKNKLKDSIKMYYRILNL